MTDEQDAQDGCELDFVSAAQTDEQTERLLQALAEEENDAG